MAWFCDRCQQEVDGSAVDVGNVGPGYEGIGPYHRACLGPVRPVRDEDAGEDVDMRARTNRARLDACSDAD